MHNLVTPVPYLIAPLRTDFLLKARAMGIDDLGQDVERLTAKGGEPCRDAFRRADAGEALILASYCPFRRAGPYREYGPVFILADADAGSVPLAGLPVLGARPYLGASFVLRAYSDDERIVDAVISASGDAESHLQRLFAAHDPAFVLARFPAYGCYALRIEQLAN
jgi:hypothetical protein